MSALPLHASWCVVLVLALSSVAAAPKPMQIKVDHASVCGSNLSVLQDGFASIGLKPDFGGPHAHGGTQMALLGFDDGSYLELIAPQKAGTFIDSGWAELIAADAGPCAWAIASHSLNADVAHFKSQGLAVDGPDTGSRIRPDGKVIAWDMAMVGPAPPGSTLPFMIQDKTSRTLRVQPSASVKGSALTGVAVVILGVNNLNAASDLFRRAYGWSAPTLEDHPEFGARLAYFPGSPVILATPLGDHSWLTERLQAFGESPVAYLLGTPDLAAANKGYTLSSQSRWFGRNLAWFDSKKLNGIRLGVIE